MSLEDKVREWLAGQGSHLELKVADLLESKSLTPLQATYYQDPETDTLREIDIRTFSSHYIDENRYLFMYQHYECKSGTSGAWVMYKQKLTGENRIAHTNMMLANGRPANDHGKTLLLDYANDLDRNNSNLLNRVPQVGYGLSEALRKNNDRDASYQATQQAINASIAERNLLVSSNLSNETYPKAILDFPAVVIERPLYAVTLSSTQELELEQIPWGTVIYRASRFGMQEIAVDIVSFDAFGDYIDSQNQLMVDLAEFGKGRIF